VLICYNGTEGLKGKQQEVMLTREEQQSPVEERQTKKRTPTVRLQTFRRCYAEILQGGDPWIPLGMFMHQFFGMYKHLRSQLVRDPIRVPEDVSPEQFRWAVFCAASVEYLCKKYEIACPAWALSPSYTLEKPWYYDINADLAEVQEDLRQNTPEEFASRNIFCGNRVFNNKYEHKGRQGRRAAA